MPITPGPWLAGERAPRHLSGQIPIIATDTGHIVAICFTEADARAVSALPKVLAALKQALRDSGCDGDLCTHGWHDTARQAIAKAEE